MSLNPNRAVVPQQVERYQANQVVLIVEDHLDDRSELNEVLAQNGYSVIETDNGQDAARHARRIRPDLLMIDLDVPLLFELVAARQILKKAQLWQLPVVIVTHEEVIDSGSIMEVGARRNEYVTRLSDYDQLQDLLDYLLPVLPTASANELTSSNTLRTDAIEHPERSFSPDAFRPT
jgi:DNA-binding response OmpR family regulator